MRVQSIVCYKPDYHSHKLFKVDWYTVICQLPIRTVMKDYVQNDNTKD